MDRLRDVNQFQRGRVHSMVVKAGANGILQELPLEVGQWAQSGATLARIVEPGRLKAVLRIPETQAKDVTIGQPAAIDTRNGIARGKVIAHRPGRAERHGDRGRLARRASCPAARGPTSRWTARSRSSGSTTCCTSAGRRSARPGSTVGLFKLTAGRQRGRARQRCGWAARRSTRWRSSAVSRQGDKVIISDMSRWDGVERVRVE